MQYQNHSNLLSFILFLLPLSVLSQINKSAISARTAEERTARVNDSLYAGRFEVTNAEYNTFLTEMVNKDSALYSKYSSDSTGWFSYSGLCEPPTFLYYHRHPAFADFPVVNIGYEAALEYCKWLTALYNADAKRKFRKVLFVLPTSREWILAAIAGHPDRLYPWGRYYLVNKKGMYMCNFKPVGDPYFVRDSMGKPTIVEYNGDHLWHVAEFPEDKLFYTMKVKSFEPNDFGIYNTSGNAAEMTIAAGYAMGGSWNSYGGEITTKSIKQYKYPSPEVGFRVFMKIIDK
jgi:formylglycine-generating enzyme required for sulfatase activity